MSALCTQGQCSHRPTGGGQSKVPAKTNAVDRDQN
jgi:hypothetical protein